MLVGARDLIYAIKRAFSFRHPMATKTAGRICLNLILNVKLDFFLG